MQFCQIQKNDRFMTPTESRDWTRAMVAVPAEVNRVTSRAFPVAVVSHTALACQVASVLQMQMKSSDRLSEEEIHSVISSGTTTIFSVVDLEALAQ